MNMIRSFVKNYFVFLLLLQLISYLTPKESYKKYVQFFTGALMAAVLLGPVLSWMNGETDLSEYAGWEEVLAQIEAVNYDGEGEDMFEIFFMEEATE
jgi:hypothetical protein